MTLNMRGRHEHCRCTREFPSGMFRRGGWCQRGGRIRLRRRLYGLHDKQTIGDFYLAISWGHTAEYQWALSRGHG